MAPNLFTSKHEEYEAFRKERQRWLCTMPKAYFEQYHTGVVVMRKDGPEGRWSGRLIHPSTTKDGYWESSQFHRDGLFGHEAYPNIEEALEEEYTYGFRPVDPVWADEVFVSREFIDGEAAAEAAMREHERRMAEWRANYAKEHPEETTEAV